MTVRPAAKIALFLGLAIVTVVAYLFLLSALRGKMGDFSAAVPALVIATLALLLNRGFLRSEGRSLAELGFASPGLRMRQIAAGFGGGVLTAGAWIVGLWCVTSLIWRPSSGFHSVAAVGSFTFIVFNNAGEELLYRGYLFLLIARAYGRWAAIVATSVLFALLHIQAGVPWQSALAGVLTSGLLFAVLFARWQSVPLVLAFHVATNVVQEVMGLRLTGLTALVPQYPAGATATQSYGVLAIVALINVGVALGVLFWKRVGMPRRGRRR
jgi:membrane protease YdiL (CAAX protease family)